jgi:hypothetical protein
MMLSCHGIAAGLSIATGKASAREVPARIL